MVEEIKTSLAEIGWKRFMGLALFIIFPSILCWEGKLESGDYAWLEAVGLGIFLSISTLANVFQARKG